MEPEFASEEFFSCSLGGGGGGRYFSVPSQRPVEIHSATRSYNWSSSLDH